MKAIIPPAVVLAYAAAIAIGVPALGPGVAEWFLLVVSVLFVWTYLTLGRGRPVVPVTSVAVLTLLFPLAVLAWIGLPSYGGWLAAFEAVFVSLRTHGLLWGLELTFPTVAAVATAYLLGRRRSGGRAEHAL
jgi:hypothetical protein